MIERYLLDTCAVIWVIEGRDISLPATMALGQGNEDGARLFVSGMSGWEVGMLISKGRLPTKKSAAAWFEDAVRMLRADVLDVTLRPLIDSSYLPDLDHNDPTDRILIATAREHDLTIITRDRAILAYGAAGHVRTLAC